MHSLNDFITTSSNTTPMSLDAFDTMLREIWVSADGGLPNSIIVSVPIFKRLHQWSGSYHGVTIKGCKGKRTVRFRRQRWQVI